MDDDGVLDIDDGVLDVDDGENSDMNSELDSLGDSDTRSVWIGVLIFIIILIILSLRSREGND